MKICMKKIRNQVPTLALIKYRKNVLNKLFKARNLDSYYKNLHIKNFFFIGNTKTILRLIESKNTNVYFCNIVFLG